jgi:hypothetical protein
VIRDNVDGNRGSFEVVPPVFERFEDGEEFFIVGVVVQFGWRQAAREEGYGVNFPVGLGLGKDSGDGVVRRVHLEDDRSVWVPMRPPIAVVVDLKNWIFPEMP